MAISSQVLMSRILARSRLRQWQLIREIASLGSLQRAADAVGISQSAATHAVTEIESLLGVQLFERHAKGMRPSDIGAVLVPKINTVMAAFSECAEALSDLSSGRVGKFRVGAIESASGELLGTALAIFCRRHPMLSVDISQQRLEQLMSGLREHIVDVAIVRKPTQLPTGIVFVELWEDHYIIACSPRHPLAGRSGVTQDQLARHEWLMPPKSTIAERDFYALWQEGKPPTQFSNVEARAPFMWTMVEQLQVLVISPFSLARPWIEKGIITMVPGTWGPALQPIGLLARAVELEERGPVRDFVETLRGLEPPKA